MHSKHKIRFKAIQHLQSSENLCYLHPPLILCLYTGCRLDETFSKSVAGFQNVKVLNIMNIICLLSVFSLILDAFPSMPKMPFWTIKCRYINIQRTYVKGVLGLGGKRVL